MRKVFIIGGALAALVLALVALPPESSGAAMVGDADCSGAIGAADALASLLDDAEITDAPCSGDTDCDADTDSSDALAILRHVSGIVGGATAAGACLPVGSIFEPTPTLATTPTGTGATTATATVAPSGGTAPPPSLTPTPTSTAGQTATSTGSSTPAPTITPTPTATPTATPTNTPTATPTATPPATASPTPQVCDQTVLVNSTDPLDAAKSLGLCSGVSAASWVLPDGATPVAPTPSFHIGHGNLLDFGSILQPTEGSKLLALSSGTARDSGDPGFIDSDPGHPKNYTNLLPPGFPTTGESADGQPCQDALSSGLDGIGLELQLSPPPGASGFEFDFNFHGSDYPRFVCSQFVDSAAVIVGGNNILTDSAGKAINVNSIWADRCNSGAWGQGPVMGPAGLIQGTRSTCTLHSELVGTGFEQPNPGSIPDDGAATGWRVISYSGLNPNESFTVRFTIWDTSDGTYDSTILFDNFRWTYD